MKVDKLANLLRQAKEAHAEHERVNPDGKHDWPDWYAHFMADKMAAEAEGRPKTEGHHENERNERNRDLYTDMIKEAHGVDQVIIGHHLVYVDVIQQDGFTYHIPAEIPSADALIFDHFEASKIWGKDRFKAVLCRLAMEPIETRDSVLREMYYSRHLAPSSLEDAVIID